jgi:uncharacterized membrane protein YgdD (TMEM256/DUF423 family)
MRQICFVIAALAGLLGATGVGAAAAAAHLGGGHLLDTAATFLMIHSAAVLALVALAQRSPRRSKGVFVAAAVLLIAGMVLFCGDFALRALAGHALFAMAAPSGGLLLICGWLAAAMAAALTALSARSEENAITG